MTLYDAYAGRLVADYSRTRRAWAQGPGDPGSAESDLRRAAWAHAYRELLALCEARGPVSAGGRTAAVGPDGRVVVTRDDGREDSPWPYLSSIRPSGLRLVQ